MEGLELEMEQYSRTNVNSITYIIESTKENPFYLNDLMIMGLTLKHVILLSLFLFFTSLLSVWVVWLTGNKPPLFLIMVTALSLMFLIQSLPLLSGQEIHLNNKITFRSSIYKVSLNKDKTIIVLRNEKNRRYLKLLGKRILNTNLFSLAMSNILILIPLTCGSTFLIFYTARHNITSVEQQILIGLLLLAFTVLPYALICYFTLEKSAHLLISNNKKRIKIYALDPEWLKKQLIVDK